MNIVQYMLGYRNADGGVVRALVDLSNALAARGHKVAAMTTDDVDAPREWDGADGRPLLHTLPFSGLPVPMLSRKALERARQLISRADVVHLHVPWDPICVQLARVCRRAGVPYVVTVHGMLDDWTMRHGAIKKRLYLSLMGRRMLEGAHVVHSAAQVEMEQSARWYPRGRSMVIPLPFDLNAFAQLPGPELARQRHPQATSGDFRVLFLGRLHPIKRIDLLIDAMALLRDRAASARLMIVGSGLPQHEIEVKHAIERQKLGDRVHLLGFVTGELKRSLYQAADMAVLPSAHESFGYAVVEAMACGTPGVVTHGVNIWRELEATGGAQVVDSSAQAIADALQAIRADPGRRKNMGRRAREGITTWLDPSSILARYEAMFREAADARRG